MRMVNPSKMLAAMAGRPVPGMLLPYLEAYPGAWHMYVANIQHTLICNTLFVLWSKLQAFRPYWSTSIFLCVMCEPISWRLERMSTYRENHIKFTIVLKQIYVSFLNKIVNWYVSKSVLFAKSWRYFYISVNYKFQFDNVSRIFYQYMTL